MLSVTQAGVPRLAQVTVDRATARKTAQTKTAQTKTATGTGGTTGTKTGTAGTKKKAGTQPTTAPAQQSSALAATAVSGGVVIQASGSLAQGLEAEQTSVGSLPTAACTSPGTNFWFTGPGQRTAARIQLYLMNAGSQVADVAVDISTDAGPLQETTDTGISVPPHGMIVQSLAAMLRNSRAIALHVRTSVGQVAAAVEESTAGGQGTWLPAAQTPARHLVIPGLPGVGRQPGAVHRGTRGEGRHRPGHGRDLAGQLPADRGHRDRPARRVGGRDHRAVAGRDPGRAPADRQHLDHRGGADPRRRRSTGRVHRGRARAGGAGCGRGQPDRAGPVLHAGAVRPARRGPGHRGRGRLGRVSQPATQDVTVAAGKSVVVSLRAIRGAPRGTPFAVVITPQAGSGPVYAGRVIMGNGAGAALQAMLPVASALTTVPLPPVHQAAITAAP